MLDTIERAIRLRTRTLSRETQRNTEPRQRRSQLMRNVAKQTLLRLHHRLETLGHRVEVTTQLSNFVLSLRQFSGYTRAEISSGELVGGGAEFQQRLREITRQPVTKDAADHEHH